MRILVIDDDPDILGLIRFALERVEGWAVTTVSSGAEALEICAHQGFDVILLDLVMPGIDGVETLRKLKKGAASKMPVICVTARMRQAELSTVLSLGAIGIIPKPFDVDGLAAEIRRFLL